MTIPTPDHAKNHALHGLRGVMSWWVVVGHVSLTFGWNLPIIDKNGLAVDVFVLLSGYVIALLIDRKAEPYGRFMVRRAFRLFPLYLVALVVSAVLLPMQIDAWSIAPVTPQNIKRLVLAEESARHLFAHLAAHIPLLQGFAPAGAWGNAAFTIIGQAWSISLEWQFYAVAPLLVWGFTDRRRLPLVLAMVAPLVLLAPLFTVAFLGAKILLFLVGMLTYLGMHKRDRLLLGSAAVLACGIIAQGGAVQLVPLAIWIVVIWSSSQPLHSAGYRLAALLGSKPLKHMGDISYSVYLLHMIPLSVSLLLLHNLKLSPVLIASGVLVLTLFVTYLASLLTHRYVEKVCINIGATVTGRANGSYVATGK